MQLRTRIRNAIERWKEHIDAMMHPAFEMEAEEFAEILRTAAEMESLGLQLDPGLRAVLLVLARQMIGTDADSDFDMSDRFIEQDEATCEETDPTVMRCMLLARPLPPECYFAHTRTIAYTFEPDSVNTYGTDPDLDLSDAMTTNG